MLLENDWYPASTRVANEASTLVQHNYRVSVICPARKGELFRETVDGVQVYRYPAFLAAGSRPGLVVEYAWAMITMVALTFWVWIRHGFDVIHLANPPDILFLIAVPYKLLGKKLVYDQHDPVPELYQAKYRRHVLMLRIMMLLEKLSCRFADAILVPNESIRGRLPERYRIPWPKVSIVGNGPNLRRLQLLGRLPPAARRNGKTVIAYIGYLGSQDGVEWLLAALRSLAYDLGRQDFHCLVIGDGDRRPTLERQAQRLGLEGHLSFVGRLPWAEAMRRLATATICLDPAPLNIYTDNVTPLKVLEYMALGKPMVLYDLLEPRAAAGDAALYARPNDGPDFARRIAQLMDDPAARERLGRAGQKRIKERLSWEHGARSLLEAYAALDGC